MKKILVPLFSLMISFNAYGGEWHKLFRADNGYLYYVDLSSIKTNGNVYYWELNDYLKPNKFGDLSVEVLKETDCNVPRKFRFLSQLYYTQPMGKGSTVLTNNKPSEWHYITPSSIMAGISDFVCNYASQ